MYERVRIESQRPTASVRVGLIGSGIQKSLSPALHMREGAALGLDYCYELIDTAVLNAAPDTLADLIRDAESRGFAGLNITHPYKQMVLAQLDELTDDAAALRAVNTIVFREGKRIGCNTDWRGFAESFRRGLPDAGLRAVVQLGAGGAGAATAHAALTLGAEQLHLFDIDEGRAARLAAELGTRFPERRLRFGGELERALDAADGLIHATPTGMAHHPGLPLPEKLLSEDLWVAEIVYVPLETDLLKTARRRNCRVLDGGGMAVFQAAEAFRLFTGVEPDSERMLRCFASLIAA